MTSDLEQLRGDPNQAAPCISAAVAVAAVALDGSAVHDWDDNIEDAEPTIRRRKRRPTLASIARQTAKANIPVAAYEFRPDGTIVAVVGMPGEAKPDAGAIDNATPIDHSEWN